MTFFCPDICPIIICQVAFWSILQQFKMIEMIKNVIFALISSLSSFGKMPFDQLLWHPQNDTDYQPELMQSLIKYLANSPLSYSNQWPIFIKPFFGVIYVNISTLPPVLTQGRKIRRKKFYEIDTWGQYYKSYNGRNLRIFVISQIVCPWQAFPAWSNVCGQSAQSGAPERYFTRVGPGLGRTHWTKLERLGQTFQLITKICKLWP